MTFQSLLIITLITSNPYPVLKCKASNKLLENEPPYTFIFDFTLTPNNPIIISKTNKTVSIFSTFGSDYDLLLFSNELNKNGFLVTPKKLFKIIQEMKKLLSIKELYNKIKSPVYMSNYINSKPLPNFQNYNKAVDKLINIRNDFIHFTPKLWSIDYSYFRTTIINIIKIMIFLLNESYCIEDVFDKIKNSNILYEMKYSIENV